MSVDVATQPAPAESRRPYLRSTPQDSIDDSTRSKVENTMMNAVRPLLKNAGSESADAEAETSVVLNNFSAVSQELDRRSRESASMVRLLEQQRRQLSKAEKDRDHAADMLARIVPVVDDTSRKLKLGMESFKPGDEAGQLQQLFTMNARSLDELERISEDLKASAAWYRSCWEQYMGSVETARQMRSA